jgi:hypothetical protein
MAGNFKMINRDSTINSTIHQPIDTQQSYEISRVAENKKNLVAEEKMINIKYDGVLLTCAQIQDRKKNYIFNPTVLDESSNIFEDFTLYLTLLKNANGPLRERFILTGNHTVCGDIELEQDGSVSVFFIDSIQSSYQANRAIKTFASVFSQDKRTIYISNQVRQSSVAGCYVFALDDLRHLFTVENYLPAIDSTYKQTGLFGYLRANVERAMVKMDALRLQGQHTEEEFDFPVLYTELPFSLQRTHQSTTLLSEIIPRLPAAELNAAMNKKRQTPAQFKEKNTCFEYNAQYGRVFNTRLEQALNKFSFFNKKFVESNGYQALLIQQKMNPFTLENFKQRISEENPPVITPRSCT